MYSPTLLIGFGDPVGYGYLNLSQENERDKVDWSKLNEGMGRFDHNSLVIILGELVTRNYLGVYYNIRKKHHATRYKRVRDISKPIHWSNKKDSS
jgi:hypothetical protein